MSTKWKGAVLSIKDKQIIISRLDKGEKGTNLAQEFGISKQQISDIQKNKDKILKFTDPIKTSYKSLKQTNMFEHFIPELKVFIYKYIQTV